MIQYRNSDFSEVSVVWREKLWGDTYRFEPTSCMCYLGGYDVQIPQKYTPVFFVAEDGGKTVGVLSGHLTSPLHFRARGLYVEPDYRHQAIARQLVLLVIEEARNQKAGLIWAAPRQSSLSIFDNLGFKRMSDFTEEGFMFGPNCYVAMNLA